MNRRTLTPLKNEEYQTILSMYRYHPKSRLRERAQMVLLSCQGFYVKQIAQIVVRNELTVSAQLSAFEEHGFLGLFDDSIPGRPARLNCEQVSQIDTWLQDSPRQANYQQSNWTLKLLRHAIVKTFGIRLSLSRLAEVVHQLDFVRIRPRHRSIVPTKEQISAAMAIIDKWVKKAQSKEVVLFYLDETQAALWATLSCCWAKKGTRPQISMGDNHGKLSIIAAANPLCGKVHYQIHPSFNQVGVVAFLRQMRHRYPGKKLVFILDNAKPHIAQSVEEFVLGDGLMKLEFLPKYTSIYCNPIERLFKWFRRVVTHNHYFETENALKAAIAAFFRSVANLPKRVISLLHQNGLENLNSLPESL